MTPLQAAATHTSNGNGTLLLLAIIAAICYLLHCLIWPFRSCTKCGGTGRFLAPNGRAWRYCRKCRGKGAQIRIGRRIWTYLNNTRRGGRS